MAKTKYVIALSDEERNALNIIISEQKESDRTVLRAKILLMSDINTAEKMSIPKLAEQLGTTHTNIDLADSYPDLNADEKAVLRYIAKSHQAFSVNGIKSQLKMTEYRARKAIQRLEEQDLIRKIGNGPSTKYVMEIESVEFLTQLQMAMDSLKKML